MSFKKSGQITDKSGYTHKSGQGTDGGPNAGHVRTDGNPVCESTRLV